MKNIIFTLSLIFTISLLSAQQLNSQSLQQESLATELMSYQKLQKMADIESSNYLSKREGTKGIKSRWYNAAFAYKSIYSSKVAAGSLFPDSTILLSYTNGLFPVSIHSIAETIDPLDEIYDESPTLNINKYMPYTLDSIGIYGIYSRHTDASIVDTLLIQIRLASSSYRYYASATSSWVQSNYSTDTLAFRGVTHDKFKNYSTEAGVVTIKYPLTASAVNDTTAAGWNYYKVAPPSIFNVPAGKQISVSYSFIPGYTWNANTDTLNKKNRFRFVSYEENGLNTYPMYTKWNWTASSILRSKELYKDAAANNLLYASTYIFTQSYKYEHHWIEFKLTANETSISENSSIDKSYSLGYNYPNPCSDYTIINYSLNKVANNVSFNVYNVLGEKVYSLNNNNVVKGDYKIKLNVTDFEAGVYFYNISIDGINTTRKMIVN